MNIIILFEKLEGHGRLKRDRNERKRAFLISFLIGLEVGAPVPDSVMATMSLFFPKAAESVFLTVGVPVGVWVSG